MQLLVTEVSTIFRGKEQEVNLSSVISLNELIPERKRSPYNCLPADGKAIHIEASARFIGSFRSPECHSGLISLEGITNSSNWLQLYAGASDVVTRVISAKTSQQVCIPSFSPLYFLLSSTCLR